MELKPYLLFIYKRLPWIIFAGFAAGIVVYVAAQRLPVKYVALTSVYIQKVPDQSVAGDFSYDGFYAQQVAENYTDTVVGLFESPAAAIAAVSATPSSSVAEVKRFQRRIKIQKVAPRIIEITATDIDAETARTSADRLYQAVEEQIEQLNMNADETNTIGIARLNTVPYVTTSTPWVLLFTAVGVMVGMFTATALIILQYELQR